MECESLVGSLDRVRPAKAAVGGLVDVRFPIGRGVSMRLVERPSRSLVGADLDRLVREMRRVADRCVPCGGLRYGVLSGDPEALDRALIALVYHHSGSDLPAPEPSRAPAADPADPAGHVVAFNAMSWLDVRLAAGPRRILHSGLSMVDPAFRRRGFSGALCVAPSMLAFLRNGLSTMWVTNVTQVPSAAGLFAGSVGSVYPAPGMSEPPTRVHSAIARELIARHRDAFGVGPEAEFDPVRFVIRNSYTGGSDDLKKSYDETAKHRDPAFNRMCEERLDYGRGDDLLQVGRITVATAALLVGRFLGRAVVRELVYPVLNGVYGTGGEAVK